MLLLSAGVSSCTFIFDDSVTQCDVDGDCQRRFADSICNLATNTCEAKPVDPTWGCLDETPLTPSNNIIDLRLQVVGGINRMPVIGALVRACGRLDTNCSPESAIVKDTPVNAAGEVIMQVPESFNGYFEVRSPPATPTQYIPEILYLPTREILRASRDEGTPRRALLFTADEGANLTRLVGGSFVVDQLPNAVVIATALTCQGQVTAGVTFNLTSSASESDATRQFYTDKNNLPRTEATETSESGTFALTNLNPSDAVGPLAISATINSLQRPMGGDSVAFVRDNWLTVIYVAP